MIAMESERGRFAGLVLAQLFFIFLTPFFGESGQGLIVLYVGVFAILAAGLYTASDNRREFGISMLFLLPVLFAWTGPDLFSELVDEELRLLTPAAAFVFTSLVVARDVARHERVTSNTLLGAINVYLLIAFSFTFVHAGIMVYESGAYTVAGVPLRDSLRNSPDPRGLATMLYFSFTTMTTLGYGDIVPVGPMARLLTSFQSVLGQLFVAIIIGRLVGLEVSARTQVAKEEG
ncbi:MAG: hypothetical protein JRF61_07275 [Deltaproteobacteria bacterium]|jgi:signal transduction histidine kinase|nr:hypothetical protein [Deltaproteobacteria bacterium]